MPTIFRDKVTAGSVTFNDPLARPAGALSWGCDTLEGWSDTPEIDVVSTPQGGHTDGEVAGDFFPASARHMIVGGWGNAATRADAESLSDVIIRDAFPRNQLIRLTRYESVPKFLDCRVSDKRTIQWVGPYSFRWVVPVMAPNPFKFGLTPEIGGPVGVAGQSTGGVAFPITFPFSFTTISAGSENSIILVNRGTASSFPVVTLHGPLVKGGWRLSNDTTGDDIRFNVGLGATDVLVIDFGAQTALLNGAVVTSSITGDFWSVVTGPNVIKLYADFDPAASLSATVYSAWE
jgi:hypothetical protein